MSDRLLKIDKTLRYRAQGARRAQWWNCRRPPANRPAIERGCPHARTTLVFKTLSDSPKLDTLQRETHDFLLDCHPPKKNTGTPTPSTPPSARSSSTSGRRAAIASMSPPSPQR